MAVFPNGSRTEPTVSCAWRCYRGHNGTDYINFDYNIAVASGMVIYSAYNGSAGNEVRVEHDDGNVTRYLHAARNLVSYGTYVQEGTRLQVQGTTGASTGKHLHFEYWPGGVRANVQNAQPWIRAQVANSAALKPTERRVTAGGPANGRSSATTTAAVVQTLGGGVKGEFDGWINGESVSGTKVWFRGAFSGDWFWSGSFTDKGTHNLKDLNPAPPTERIVADVVNIRKDHTTDSDIADVYAQGAKVLITGYVTNGENIANNNGVWFKSSKGWTVSSAYTSQSTAGLKNETVVPDTPEPTPAATRVVTQAGGPLNIRLGPDTGEEVVTTIDEGTTVPIEGYTTGLSISGNANWFKVSRGWAWSGGFTDTSTTGLKLIQTEAPAEPTPDEPYVARDPELVNLVAADFPSWIEFDTKADADDTAQTNQEAYEYYLTKGKDYKYYPIESHTHWWGDPSANVTHDGIVNYLAGATDLSVHFVTSANRITRMVSVKRVAYTTGQRSMYAWTSENDPKLTEDGYKTLGWLHYAMENKNPRLRGENIRLHKEFMATSCSMIDTHKVRTYANRFYSGDLDPATGQPPVVAPEPEPTPEPSDSVSKSDMLEFATGLEAVAAQLRDRLA